MKRPYVFEEDEIFSIRENLLNIKKMLKSDSELKIEVCDMSIDYIIGQLTIPKDSIFLDMED